VDNRRLFTRERIPRMMAHFRPTPGNSAVAIALIASFAVRAQSSARPTTPPAARAKPGAATEIATVPDPPAAVGCYTYKPNAQHQWRTVSCLPPKKAALIPRPNTGGAYSTPGLSGTSALVGGSVNVQMLSNWNETDSLAGRTSFSVQMNTNNFNAVCQSSNPNPPAVFSAIGTPCINGDSAVVQFTYETDDFARKKDTLCIWNVDRTQQYYFAPQTWQQCATVNKAGFWAANMPLILATNHYTHMV
jgi:hypothetical protein